MTLRAAVRLQTGVPGAAGPIGDITAATFNQGLTGSVDYTTLTRLREVEGISPRSFSAAADGVTDDSTALAAALAQSVITGRPVVLADGDTYKVASTLTLNGTLAGRGTIVGPAAGSTIAVTSATRLYDVRMAGQVARHLIFPTTSGANASGAVIDGVRFAEGASGCIGIGNFGGNRDDRNVTVQNCVFTNISNPIFMPRLSASIIRDNRFSGTSGANIMVKAGIGNLIAGNDISGGTTGISNLCDYATNGSQYGGYYHNVITGNRISGATEESISLDGTYSSTTQMAVRECVPIASLSSGSGDYRVTLTGAGFTGAGSWCAGALMVPVTGKAIGSAFRVKFSADARLDFGSDLDMSAAAFANLSVRDMVMICTPPAWNQISGNTITAIGSATDTVPLTVWGASVGNHIFGNTIQFTRGVTSYSKMAMQVSSLVGLDTASTLASTERFALSVANEVYGNSVYGGDIRAFYRDYGATTPRNAELNRFYKNNIQNGDLIIDTRILVPREPNFVTL